MKCIQFSKNELKPYQYKDQGRKSINVLKKIHIFAI